MSLSVPTIAEWLDHAQLPSVEDERHVERLLQTATDLLQVHSGVEEEPAAGTVASRIALEGKCALAHALYVRAPDLETIYSPYSSERLGSYAWNRAQKDILSGEFPTGVFWFDRAVEVLRGEITDDELKDLWHSGEAVFSTDGGWEEATPWHGGLGPGVGAEMAIDRLLAHRCVVLRLTMTNLDGAPSYDYRPVATDQPCRVDLSFHRPGQDRGWTPEAGRPADRAGVCFFPADAPVRPGDRIRLVSGGIEGTFQVEGAVSQPVDRFGKLHHTEAEITEVAHALL